jgi:hypothetical protein
MFAPLVTNPRTNVAPDSANKRAPQRSLLMSRPPALHEREAVAENGKAHNSRGAAWDFSKIPIGAREEVARPLAAPSSAPVPLLSAARHMLVAKAGDEAVDALRQGIGEPFEKTLQGQFEKSLGYDFSRVRVHVDERTGRAAMAIGARAYTVGRHIAFAPGTFDPQTASGRELIAHELVHTVQQGQRDLPGAGSIPMVPQQDASEVEAGHAARDNIPSVARRRALGIARDHSFADFLKKVSKEFNDQLFFDMLEQIGTPQFHKDEVLNLVDRLDVDYIKRAVDLIQYRTLSDIAGSPQGTEVVQHMLARLPAGSTQHGVVESVLESRTGPKAIPTATAKPEDVAAIDRINKAISSDPHKAEYAKATVPLRFPVEIYTAGRAVDGGVYYDPNLTEAGQTPLVGVQMTTGSKTTRLQYPLLFIKLGPSVLQFTDTFIQATLWHEFAHYVRANEFRRDEADKSTETKQLEEETAAAPGSEVESGEAEATSKEMAEYGANLNDDEVRSNLLYLGRFLAGALPDFRTQAIDRIVASAITAGQVKRLVKLIDGLHNKKRKAALKSLRDALAAASGKSKP